MVGVELLIVLLAIWLGGRVVDLGAGRGAGGGGGSKEWRGGEGGGE